MKPIDRLDSLSLRDLRALVVLAELRHFGQAAERLGISQPSLSAAIRKIEVVLRTPVFRRTSRRCELTEPGYALVEQARRVIHETERLAELTEKQRVPMSGRFRLGVIPTIAPYYLPHVFVDLTKEFPNLELVLREETSDQLLLLLRRGAIDAALMALPLPDNDTEILELPILQEELALAVPPDHPLAGRNRVRVSDVEIGNMILLEHGHCLRDQVLQLCGTNGAHGCIHATSLETLRFMVQARVGYAVMPALAVHRGGAAESPVKYLRFQTPAPSRTLGLVAMRRSTRLGDAQTMAHFLAQLKIPAARLS